MVIGELPTLCSRRYPNKKATVYRGQSKTFAEFNDRVNQIVDALRKRGIKPGDKVAALSRNNPEVLEIMFAAAKAGTIYVPINFRLAADELRFVLNDAGIDIFFVGDDFLEIVGSIKNNISIPHILDMGAELEAFIASGSNAEPPVISNPDDLFAIYYTSGTTGGPKGVMLTHENFMSAAINHVIAYKLGPHDVCLHVMPFYHTMEASMVICQFYVGGTNVIVDIFNGDEFWRLVAAEGVTHITLVYTMLIDIADAFRKKGYERGSLRVFSLGGQTTPVAVIRDAIETFGEGSTFIVYGLTEASPLIAYVPPEDMVLDGPRSRLLGSVGKELFTCHVRVVDDKDNDIKPGEIGEIIVRGPNVMQGYWKRPKETEEALRGGWLRTGDVGTIDGEGYIYIVDRKKDLIISGGENISPHEVEDVLYKHPAVKECSVIGIPDDRWGEQVKAVVAIVKEAQVKETELIKYCIERLAKYKCPRSVVFVDALPKDPVGKVQKRILRDMFAK